MRMIARVAAVRIEESWEIPGSRVKCLARLTRSLSPAEVKRLEDTKVFHTNGNVVSYVCRPEESEELAARLDQVGQGDVEQDHIGNIAPSGIEPTDVIRPNRPAEAAEVDVASLASTRP